MFIVAQINTDYRIPDFRDMIMHMRSLGITSILYSRLQWLYRPIDLLTHRLIDPLTYRPIDLLNRLASYILCVLLSLCISCGYIARNISFGPPEREIEKLYRRADGTYNEILEGSMRSSQRNWSNVIRQFDEIARGYPKSRVADDAQYNIGSCYIWTHGILKDSPQKAIRSFEYLIKHYPDSEFVDDAYYWKAYAHSLKRDYRRAIEEYEEFTRRYPQSKLRKEAVYQIEECRARLGGREESSEPKQRPALKDHTPESPPVTGRKPEKIHQEAPDEQVGRQTYPTTEADQPPSVPIEDSGTQLQQETPSKYSHVENIRFHSRPEFTRVVMDLSGPVKYEIGRLENPDRIYVDLQAAFITPPMRTISVDDKVVKRIRSAQFDESTVRVALDIKQIQRYNIFCLTEPDRLVVDIYGTDGSDVPPSRPSPPDQPQSVPLVKQLGLKVKTIVIDPGHGGKDPGAVSKSGLQEKHVVLDIAKRLKTLLESSGSYHVYLTRETDIFIPLEERTAFANQKGADVFISLHVNSHKSRDAQGIETYYLSLASDEEARLTAALENASAGKTVRDLSSLLRYILRGTKVEESRELARTVQSRLCRHSGANDRGIRRAPFIVLIGAEAPSILVELGFMSNRQDERVLRTEEYRDKLARALMDAVEDYIKTIDQAS